MGTQRDRPTVRRLTAADHEDAALVLANAFADDPVLTWPITDRPNIEERLRHLFHRELAIALTKPDSLVDVIDGGGAVALWHAVDDWKSSLRNLPGDLASAFRTFGTGILRALRLRDKVEQVHPTDPHRYLAFIGVHNDHQGKGLGSALLGSMVEELDEQGLPAYLESSKRRNDALYARFGFEERGVVDLPFEPSPMRAMWRPPR